jgi:acetyl esterase/lipase
MLKNILSGGALCLFVLSANAQMKQPIQYKDLVFPAVAVEKDQSYSPGQKGRSVLFDLYQPEEDSTALRPLIIWMHGGGFKFGSKDQAGIKLWSNSFARRGYVCAAINYQLGKQDLRFTFTDLVKNCYRAVQDARQAILFFRNNAARWRIDTSRIILAGNSAGGMIALQAAYSSDAELLRLIGSADSTHVSDTPDPGHVSAIVNFWGGIFNPEWLQQARVPIVSVHGKKDKIVAYDHKGYPLYGSYAIHKKADSLGIPNRLKLYDDYSHELQKFFNPLFASAGTKRRWLEAGQFAADFLYDELWGGRDAGGGQRAGGGQQK